MENRRHYTPITEFPATTRYDKSLENREKPTNAEHGEVDASESKQYDRSPSQYKAFLGSAVSYELQKHADMGDVNVSHPFN